MAKKQSFKSLEKEVIKFLTDEGERIIKTAYSRRNWRNRTYNLHDSYGSAVFKNGALLRDTIRYVSSEPKANAYRNDKELGDYRGQRSKAQKGSSYHEFGKADKPARFLDGDTIQAYGRDEVNKFFNGYKLATTSGLELVVVAAMYYAGILESGYLGTKYQVISSATTELNKIAQLLGKGVDVYALEIDRNRDEAFTNSAFDVRRGQKLN
jgi:hypothetical protein